MKKQILNSLLMTSLIGVSAPSMFASETILSIPTDSMTLLAQNNFSDTENPAVEEGGEEMKKKKKKRKKRRKKRRRRKGGKEHGAQETKQNYFLDLSANLKVDFQLTPATAAEKEAATEESPAESTSVLNFEVDIATYYILADKFGIGPIVNFELVSQKQISTSKVGIGAGGRYYMGNINKDKMIFFGGLGAVFSLNNNTTKDVDGNANGGFKSSAIKVPVEIGMHYFLDSNVTISPALFFDYNLPLSNTELDDEGNAIEPAEGVEVDNGPSSFNFGLKLGIGTFF